MYHNTVLFLVLGLCLVHVIQPSPANHGSTILSDMKRELTSIFGGCSFPPSDVISMVMENPDEEQFLFLHKCNVRLARNHVDDDADVLCMTLYDIGLNICATKEKQAFVNITQKLPHDSTEFKKLVDKVENEEHENICPELTSVLHEPHFPQTNNWNLKDTFTKTPAACDRLCYDYTHTHVNTLCKLIFYSSSLLMKHADESIPMGNVVVSQDPPPKAADTTRTQTVKEKAGVTTQNGDTTRFQGDTTQIDKQPEDQSFTGEREESKHSVVSSEAHTDTTAQKQIELAVSGSEPGVEYTNSKPSGSADDLHMKSSSSQSDKTTDVAKETELPKPVSGQQTVSKPVADGTGSVAAPVSVPNGGADVSPGKPPQVSQGKPDVVESVPPVSEGKPDVAEIPQVSADGNLPELEDGNSDPSDLDDDQNYPNGGIEAPEPDVPEKHKSYNTDESSNVSNGITYKFEESEESHFFTYFTTMVLFSIIGYLVFHNKQKILALVLEGRSRRNNNRRRPNTANYHKLDCNLEEAVSSPCNTSSNHVIY